MKRKTINLIEPESSSDESCLNTVLSFLLLCGLGFGSYNIAGLATDSTLGSLILGVSVVGFLGQVAVKFCCLIAEQDNPHRNHFQHHVDDGRSQEIQSLQITRFSQPSPDKSHHVVAKREPQVLHQRRKSCSF